MDSSNAEGWFFKGVSLQQITILYRLVHSFSTGSIALAKTLMEDAIICYNEALKADPSFFEAYESTYVWLLRLRLYSMESNRVNYWLLIEY